MTKTKNIKTKPEAIASKQSKKEQMIELLRREDGASLDEMVAATSWQPHTTRAMLTGLRKKGYGLAKQKGGGTTRYTIASEPAA